MASTTSSNPVLDSTSTRDSFIPLFNGQHGDYKEWRKRIKIYMMRMNMTKRGHEAILNLVGSLTGIAWKVAESYDLEDLEKKKPEEHFDKLIKLLDSAFEYDNRVQLPADFDRYFVGLQRRPGQTLLQYVTEHDECLRRLSDHKIDLPRAVQGWHLLRKAGLTREQKQLIMTQAPTLDRLKVQEALYLVLGQDHRAATSDHRRPFRGKGKGRAYMAEDEDENEEMGWDDDSPSSHAYYEQAVDDSWLEGASTWETDEIYYMDGEEGAAFDEDAVYYQEEQPVDLPYVEEFDEAYAAYVDARKRFNDIKLSRGYLPIVALTESQANLSPGISSTPSSPTSPSGKGKKGKGKGKGKSKNVFRYPARGPGKQPDPKGRAQASMVCLRCGGNHFTNMCPVQRTTSNKRPASSVESTVFDGVKESGMVIFQDQHGHERPDCVMLDPGASAFLSGFGPFKRYVEQLEKCGYDISNLQFMRCERRFHFGGDAQADCRWTVKLPIYVGGRFGYVQMYLLKGETPMLLGRPIMENLGILLDCRNKMLKFDDSPWFPAVVGASGEYLLPLLDDYDENLTCRGPSFDLVVPSDGGTTGELLPMDKFDAEEKVFVTNGDSPMTSTTKIDGERTLRRHLLHTCEVHLTSEENKIHAYVTSELHEKQSTSRVLWEVYCGHGRTSQLAEVMGMEVKVFSYETGWNFDDPRHQQQFLEMLNEEMPDEVFLAPTCGPWSVMQNINARSDEQREQLHQLREQHHRVHLRFVKKVYLAQIYGGRHAHLEQPEGALSWHTSSLKNLPGYWAAFDQCRYGVQCLDVDGEWRFVRKSTAILTTKMAVKAALHLRCQGGHVHCRAEGHAPGYGKRTKYLEDYQPALAATIAAAMLAEETPQAWENAMVVPEHKEFAGKLASLHTEVKAEAIRTVQRLHRNLGHPSADALADLLVSRGASEEVVTAARSYQCAACLRYKKPNQVAPASVKRVKEFGEVLQADIFWIRSGSSKFPILSVIDMATKYQVAAVTQGEKGEDLLHALERSWIRHFGLPQKLVTDEGRGWVGSIMEEWTNFHGVEHEVAPGEAHSRLALVERRHAVLRKSIEVYLTDLQKEGVQAIREALTYIMPQINATPSVAGFSPTQWVIGKQVRLPGELAADQLVPSKLGGHHTFEEMLLCRNTAKQALIEAETDNKLRRALLRKYQGSNIPLQVGQRCFFWRDARQADLVKIRWHGPARVVMVECDDEGSPRVYWISYKTQLIRCAPHHVRSDFTSSEHVLEDLQAAKKEVQALKSRGVTRFLDLQAVNKRDIDDILEEDEDMANGDDDQGDGDDYGPPRQRRRLDDPLPEMEMEYAPTTPPTSPQELNFENVTDPPLLPEPELTDLVEPGNPVPQLDQQTSPMHVTASDEEDGVGTTTEPSGEPSAPPTVPATPAGPAGSQGNPLRILGVDPNFAELYDINDQESFHQRRRRIDMQETFNFGPVRHPPRVAPPTTPYEQDRLPVPVRPTATSMEQPSTEQSQQQRQQHSQPDSHLRQPDSLPPTATSTEREDSLYSQVFEIQEIEENELPVGWHVDEQGYFQLEGQAQDYWEVRAGCVIRHHVTPRRLFYKNKASSDCPIALDDLDLTRVTVVKAPNGRLGIYTDSNINPDYELDYQWTGLTIYQIRGPKRKVLAMFSRHTPQKLAKQYIQHEKKKVEKNKNNLSERNMTLSERESFTQAKVKELKSFFENGVWEFSTAAEADSTRTLSSRMLLKWSKNSDGTPRAKARLIVRGYADRDALEGKIDTAAPTTSRLSRAMLLSMMATMGWSGWTADVSTAFLQGLPQERKLWVKLPSDALRILGAPPDTRMFLVKPCYGQLDAPRRWFLEAVRRLKSLGFRQHLLDPCLFLLYEADFAKDDSPDIKNEKVFGDQRLCGMICLHVDDMLGSGNHDSPVYKQIERKLQETFTFREWQTSSKLEYCGATLEKEDETGTWKLHHSEYLRKVKPIAIGKERGPEDYMTPNELTKFRGLLGSLQWPAVQSQPHLQCATSMLAGQMSAGLIKSIHDGNKLLRFAKENADVSLRYGYLDRPENLRLVCMFDAAFCVRRDNSSQGGYIVMLVPESTFHGTETEYHVLDWKSSKLPRVARSSLGAEAQAAGQATDSVDFICKFWDHIQHPNLTLEQLLRRPCDLRPILITDAKALYDSYFREGSTSSITDKRIGLEVQVMKERLQALGGTMKWISSERQFADSLTKDATKQLLADRLRYHKIKFTWDPEYQAAKKKSVTDRNISRDEFSAPKPADKKKDLQNEEEELQSDVKMEDVTEEVFVKDSALVVSTLYPLEYVNMIQSEAVVVSNAAAQNEGVPENDIMIEDEDTAEYVYAASHGVHCFDYYSEFLKNFATVFKVAVLVLTALALQGFGGQEFRDGEGFCGLNDQPEEEHYGVFEVLVAIVMVAIYVVGYSIGKVQGWRAGRAHRLDARHIGYERLLVEKNQLEDQVESLKVQLVKFKEVGYRHGRGLVGLRDENYDLAEYIMFLESESSDKDTAIQELRNELEETNHQLSRHVQCKRSAQRVLQRADRELQDHYSLSPFRQPIFLAKTGRVWHHTETCQALDHAAVRELPACTFCAGRLSIPPRDMATGHILIQDVQQWLINYND